MYREQAATGRLSPWVECAWSFETRDAAEGRVPPDGCVDILYERGRGLRAIGTMTAEQRFDYAPGAAMTGVRFRPGVAGGFLRVSPAEFTDLSIRLDDLWPRRAREIESRLDDAPSIQEAPKLLLEQLVVPASSMSPVQQAIHALTAAHGNVDLDQLASQANLSPRQFRRRCLEESGLTPKHLARVLRFRNAYRMARSAPSSSWSAVALDAGYYDQSHFIRDFREFMLEPPMAVLSNTGIPVPA